MSRKNKWRQRGRLEFRRETKRYSDGGLTNEDVLYIRVKGIACAFIENSGSVIANHMPGCVVVHTGTFRILPPVKAAHHALDYLNAMAFRAELAEDQANG